MSASNIACGADWKKLRSKKSHHCGDLERFLPTPVAWATASETDDIHLMRFPPPLRLIITEQRVTATEHPQVRSGSKGPITARFLVGLTVAPQESCECQASSTTFYVTSDTDSVF